MILDGNPIVAVLKHVRDLFLGPEIIVCIPHHQAGEAGIRRHASDPLAVVGFGYGNPCNDRPMILALCHRTPVCLSVGKIKMKIVDALTNELSVRQIHTVVGDANNHSLTG